MTCVIHTLYSGDHILCCDDVYGGTNRYLRRFSVEKHKYEVDFVNMTDYNSVEKGLKSNTKLVWIETPTNPLLKIIDIEEIVKIVRKKNGNNTIVVVDNTFSSPYLQSPLTLGADIVAHSLTKYIGGHSDVVMGCLIFNDETLKTNLEFAAKSFGGCPSVFDCYLAMRGLKTLEARMKVHCKNAYSIANYLE